MKYIIAEKNINYDGSQLRSHWILNTLDIYGDAAAAFIGKCDIKLKHMVDIEDVRSNNSIYSEEMLHFIIEHFDISLKETVFRQRILICIMKEALEKLSPELKIIRRGDDLFDGKFKITISIATKSPVSGLLHAGINIISENTPVLTKGLKDFAINPKIYAELVLKNYEQEFESVKKCMAKVKWVN